jgi:hypothetical protein
LYTPYDANGQPQDASLTRYYFGGALETSGSSVKKYYSFAGQTVRRLPRLAKHPVRAKMCSVVQPNGRKSVHPERILNLSI